VESQWHKPARERERGAQSAKRKQVLDEKSALFWYFFVKRVGLLNTSQYSDPCDFGRREVPSGSRALPMASWERNREKVSSSEAFSSVLA
jgi:hypothetical protein